MKLGQMMMSDLISRHDAIRKCCGEKCGCEREDCGYIEACSEVMRLESLPSADAVEVVRCKDCKWHQDGTEVCQHLVWDDDFCSFRDRRTDD